MSGGEWDDCPPDLVDTIRAALHKEMAATESNSFGVLICLKCRGVRGLPQGPRRKFAYGLTCRCEGGDAA